MENLNAYKMDRYKTAFSDYEAAVRKFHEGVLELFLEDQVDRVSIKALARELEVKHKHFIECASRLGGSI